MNAPIVVWFEHIDKDDLSLVGGKGANLGELTKIGIPVPSGFVVTAPAYFHFLEENNLTDQIRRHLKDLDVEDNQALTQSGHSIQKLILESPMPQVIESEILFSYKKLREGGRDLVAVRSSATAEDIPGASFAGQQATFLNIKGEQHVLSAVQKCWASLFEPRAIFYRTHMKFDHLKVGIAVPIQRMVLADVSGVMFTIDPITNDRRMIVIEAIWGLGELIVQGAVTPDHYVVDKTTLGFIRKEYVEQFEALCWKGGSTVKEELSISKRGRPKLSDASIETLARLGRQIEKHYLFPQDIEWALEDQRVFIVQTRPVTTISKSGTKQQKVVVPSTLALLFTGSPASPGIATGPVRIVNTAAHLYRVKKGDVLVTEMTNPDFVPAMRRAVAVVTDRGGRTSHAAIVSRELGIVCVVGTEVATKTLINNQIVTVDGKAGKVYRGGAPTTPHKEVVTPVPQIKKHVTYGNKTATKLYVNLAEPDKAWEISTRNCDGVGLLRAEFMIAQIGVHPKKLIAEGRGTYFARELAQGIATFAESFYPRPVVYRATDFKTNEYRNLQGGDQYEPEEPNPMLGYRGSFRYIHDPKVFRLELDAIASVRKSFNNVWLMIPFVRTVQELKQVKQLIIDHGLSRTASFKLWMMAEIPSNVILLNQFLDVGIDGISIGSNDLTMLMLGTDRDNSEVASAFDEQNEAILWALERVITTCAAHRVTSSICGQAPSMYTEFTRRLVRLGITSVSVSPDAIDTTREVIADTERMLVGNR